MGYGWTMEGWDPRLVHALALHHRVVMFDNSGVGRTQELPQPFSVDAMADQTSAFLFQDWTRFAVLVNSFLAGNPIP
jgi:pimeloyl-ACP methyl ester carboxylesterase